jgi:hypothetical protein
MVQGLHTYREICAGDRSGSLLLRNILSSLTSGFRLMDLINLHNSFLIQNVKNMAAVQFVGILLYSQKAKSHENKTYNFRISDLRVVNLTGTMMP